jgi:hypothetical protein
VTRLISTRTENREGQNRIVLRLGPTDYKTFLVTCLRDHAWFENNVPTAIAPALGNSVLLTHGERAILGVRSQKVSCYPGHGHLLGGVAELLGTEKFPASAAGLIAHLRLELREEAGIDIADLAPGGPRICGLARDPFLHQPELYWQWETHVELERIAERLDASEHSGSVILDKDRITEAWGQRLTPVARHVIARWAGQSAPPF